MGLQFERPVGSPLDVAELEYCSALRQTDLTGPLTSNGSLATSLTSDDVRLHILSRHGVKADLGEVEQSILYELAGGIQYEEEVEVGDVDEEADNKGNGPTGLNKKEEEVLAGDSFIASGRGRGTSGGGGQGGTGGSAVLVPFAGGGQDDEQAGAAAAGEVEIVPDGQGKQEEDGKASAGGGGGASVLRRSRRRTVRRVTPLDLVQQVSLLLIPELKKLRVKAQEEEDDDDDEELCNDDVVDDDIGPSDLSHHEIRSALRRMVVDGDGGHNNNNGSDQRDASSPARRRPTLRTIANNAGRGLVKFPNGVRDLFGSRNRAKVPVMDAAAVDAALLVLLENTGLAYGTELTPEAIRKILISFDEEAWDDDTIEQMIEQARGGGTDESSVGANHRRKTLKLDKKTFLRALTNDLDMYDETAELAVTTHFEDANQMASRGADASSTAKAPNRTSRHASIPSMVPNGEGADKKSMPSPPALKRVFTASSIDYTADTYASLTWAVFAWYLLAGFFFLYMFNELNRRMFPLSCDDAAFGCKIANAVVLWLEIMIKLCVVGFVYVTLSALGNSVYLILDYGATTAAKVKSAAMILVSMATVLLSTVVAYFVQVDAVVFDTTIPVTQDDFYAYDPAYDANSTNSTAPSDGAPRRNVDVVLASTLVLGLICVAIQTIQLVRIFIPRSLDLPRLFEYAASSAKTMERKTKQAASQKVRQMVSHAIACHRTSSNPLDSISEANYAVPYDAKNQRRLAALKLDGRISHALLHFQEQSLRKETVGGLLYTYRGFAQSGIPLTTKEGIWVFPRLLWCHLGQWIVIVGLIVVLIQVPILLAENIELDGPTLGQLQSIVIAGGAVALTTCVATVSRYLPSAVTTILSFRSGVRDSLRYHRSFHVYSFAQDTSTALFGS